MKNGIWGLNGILIGLLAALLSSALVLGSFVLSISEASRLQPPPAEITQVAVRMTPLPPLPTAVLASATESAPTPSLTSTPAATATLSATACPSPPPDWLAILILKNDNLNDLAARYGASPEDLIKYNCLKESQLREGSQFYVPASTPTLFAPTQAACAIQADWPLYTVQPGDTLFRIAVRVGSSVSVLKSANCLLLDTITVGMQLHVPFLPPPPIPTTPPPWPSPSPIPTDTATPPPVTATPLPTEPPTTTPPAIISNSPTPGGPPGTPPPTGSANPP